MLQKIQNLRSKLSNWIDKKNSTNTDPDPAPPEPESSVNEGLFKLLTRKLKELQNATGERAEQLAESLARQITSWTGKETSVEDVKRGAKNGAIVGTLIAMVLVARNASTIPACGTNAGDAANHWPVSGQTTGSYGGSNRHYPSAYSGSQSDEEWREQVRIEEDHREYVMQEEQQQYFDQMQDQIDEQISYNDSYGEY